MCGSGAVVCSWSLLFAAIIAVVRQKLHLSTCSNLRVRLSDRREDLAAEQFDEDIKEPIREAYKELRLLSAAVADASDLSDADRPNELQTIREKTACKAFNYFMMALAEADQRLKLNGTLSDINADLEDEFFTTIAVVPDRSNDERRAMVRKITTGIISAITRCDAELKVQRARYISKSACMARDKASTAARPS